MHRNPRRTLKYCYISAINKLAGVTDFGNSRRTIFGFYFLICLSDWAASGAKTLFLSFFLFTAVIRDTWPHYESHQITK